MLKIFKKETTIFILLSLIFLTLSYISLIYSFINTPPDSVFLATDNYYLDYHQYLSEIAQGQSGDIFLFNKFTTEPHQSIFLRPILPLSGFILAPFKLPPHLIYHLLKIITTILFFISTYYFISLFLKAKNQRLFSFFLIFASASFPKVLFRENIEIYTFFNWWTSTSLSSRISFLPHHNLANLLLITTLILLYKSTNSKKLLYPASLITFFLSFSTPTYVILLLFFYFAYQIYQLKITKIQLNNLIFNCLKFTFIPAFGLLYTYLSHQKPPWKQINDWVSSQSYNIQLHEYLLSFGPIIILGLIGIILLIKAKNNQYSFPLIFTFSFFILLTSLTIFPNLINPIRLIEVPISIFFSLFAIYFLKNLKTNLPVYKITAILIILISLPAYKINFLDPITTPPHYLGKDIYQAFSFLKNQGGKDDTVFCSSSYCSLIPAYTNKFVYQAHPVSTLNFIQKQQLASQYFSLAPAQAKNFLIKNNISYLFIQDQSTQNHPFLKKIFGSPQIVIYKLIVD